MKAVFRGFIGIPLHSYYIILFLSCTHHRKSLRHMSCVTDIREQSLNRNSHSLAVTSLPQRLLTISHSFFSASTLPLLEQLLELKGHHSSMFMPKVVMKGK